MIIGALMKAIDEVILMLKDSYYFESWEEVLYNKTILILWQEILTGRQDIEKCNSMGKYFYTHRIPFVIIIEYIDEFFRHYHGDLLPTHTVYRIKNHICEGYLDEKLAEDKKDVQKDRDIKLIGSMEKNRSHINAHLDWLQQFIDRVKNKDQSLELDPCCCTVGRWLEAQVKSEKTSRLNDIHQRLHALARSALHMYEKHDYAYFLLLYMDILILSYEIRDKTMDIYFVDSLCSIYEDPLTHLPNYLDLFHILKKTDASSSLLLFNIRDFGKINILEGHDRGDAIIKDIASYLQENPKVSKAFHLYADEFAVLIQTEDAMQTAMQLKTGIEGIYFQIKDTEASVRLYGSVGTVKEHVLEHCEFGLIVSREDYGKIIDVDKIKKETIDDYSHKYTFQQRLRLAFSDHRFFPFVQPILDIKKNKIVSYEVLMRMHDEDGKIKTPGYFLADLQTMYIYPEVTKLIIEHAFEIFKDLPYRFSINLSYRDILNNDTRIFIASILKLYPDAAKRCTFELLEEEAVLNLAAVNSFFMLLHGYGVKIALDDFGTGYSNYDTIFQLDIDKIKIDGTLIQNINKDEKSRAVVESIVTIARMQGAKVTAEWVSDKEIFETVKAMGIDYAQGYYIEKPHDPNKIKPSI